MHPNYRATSAVLSVHHGVQPGAPSTHVYEEPWESGALRPVSKQSHCQENQALLGSTFRTWHTFCFSSLSSPTYPSLAPREWLHDDFSASLNGLDRLSLALFLCHDSSRAFHRPPTTVRKTTVKSISADATGALQTLIVSGLGVGQVWVTELSDSGIKYLPRLLATPDNGDLTPISYGAREDGQRTPASCTMNG